MNAADSVDSHESRSRNATTAMTQPESSKSDELQPWNEDGAQIILVLVGLIASGKSTFAQALQENFPQFRRCNQDDLRDRRAVEWLARQSLERGLSVCIDRTNIDETQRAHWTRIAREFPSTKLWCILFNTPPSICRERLQYRTNHPTIRSSEEGIQVLRQFQNSFRPPSAEEGFERILNMKPEDHPSPKYTRNEVQNVLVRVATSSPPARSLPQRGIREYFQAAGVPLQDGGLRRGNWRDRGRARGRMHSRPNEGFWRHAGRDGPSGPNLSPNLSQTAVGRAGSYNSRQTESAFPKIDGRVSRHWEQGAFQDDRRIGRAAELVLSSISRPAPDEAMPSKQHEAESQNAVS